MRPRFVWRPYVLRAFFDTQLLIAESKGKIAHDFRVFFMGHKGSMEAKYTTNKSILPKSLLDEMRDAFKKSEEFLDLEKTGEDPLERSKEDVKNDLERLSQEQLAKVQELVRNLADCKTDSELSLRTMQNGSYQRVGDMSIVITNMNDPMKVTTIERKPKNQNGHPLKIVTGKKNCAILRIESVASQRLFHSLEKDKRYNEFVVLSPFAKDDVEFTRILFLDADYVKHNERYILAFGSLATITYNRGVITLIGDEMWRVQQIASKASSKIGEVGLNILNMDAQEETSRIIIVIEDARDNIEKAIRAVHAERSKIKFV